MRHEGTIRPDAHRRCANADPYTVKRMRSRRRTTVPGPRDGWAQPGGALAWLLAVLIAAGPLTLFAQQPAGKLVRVESSPGSSADRLLAAGDVSAAVKRVDSWLRARAARGAVDPRDWDDLLAPIAPERREALLRGLMPRWPGDVEIRERLAADLARRGVWADAVELLEPLQGRLSVRGVQVLTRGWTAMGRGLEASRWVESRLKDQPTNVDLWGMAVEIAMSRGQFGRAITTGEQAARHCRPNGRLRALLAEALFRLDQLLGDAEVRQVPGRRVGQFDGDWLLVEARPGVDRYLCAPQRSALYQVRAAIDAGCDTPELHRLHAAIWLKLGHAETAWDIVASRLDVLLESAGDADGLLRECALRSGRITEFLDLARGEAQRDPAQRDAVLFGAYCAAADVCARRGEPGAELGLLRQALSLRPEASDVRLRVADALWVTGEQELAREEYAAILRAAPAHPQKARLLARLAE